MPADSHVMTVLGPVAPEALGPTLIHEHALFDLSVYHRQLVTRGEAALPDEPLGMEHLYLVRHNVPSLLDNTIQRDLDVAAAELAHDPAGLAEIARRTGLHLVAGTGYYIGISHPPELAAKSAEQVAEEMLRDFTDGFPGTNVRAGVIGEIGTSEPLTPTAVPPPA